MFLTYTIKKNFSNLYDFHFRRSLNERSKQYQILPTAKRKQQNPKVNGICPAEFLVANNIKSAVEIQE